MTAARLKTCALLTAVALLALPALARAHAPGDLDRAFGDRGVAAAASVRGYDSSSAAVAVDSRGRIVVAATVRTALASAGARQAMQVRVARFLPGGERDRSFGDRGVARLSLGRYGTAAWGVAVTREDDIVVAGSTAYYTHSTCCTTAPDGDLMLARFEESGALAWTRTRDDGPGGYAAAVAVDRRGRIVVGGSGGVDRLWANGVPDVSFGADGTAAIDGSVADLALAPDGDILVAAGGEAGGAVTRLGPGGRPDRSFAGDGSWEGGSFVPTDLALDARGAPTVTGRDGSAPVAIRLTRRGAPNASFGTGGAVVLPAPADDVVIDRAGRTLVVSRMLKAVQRLQRSGRLDLRFGRGGGARSPLEQPKALAVGRGGGILVGATALSSSSRWASGHDRFGPAVVRLLSERGPKAVRPAR
jgi:uncharacterized delta-60 repeat protein